MARADEAAVATLEMVAAEAGVSRSTVSRVVNESPNVRPDVAQTVREVIARLNYVPNRAARSLASRQTNSIALVVPEDTSRFFGDPYFASVVSGIVGSLDETDYVLTMIVASTGFGHKTRRYLQAGSVDGILVISHHPGVHQLMDLTGGLPMVFGGRPRDAELGDTYYIDVDNVAGAAQATRHLVDRGRRRIGTITGSPDMQASIDRRKGWKKVVAGAGQPVDAVANGDFTAHGGAEAMAQLLDAHPDLDAVFAASDLMALGALMTLADRGLRVPHDIAVVGFDNSPLAASGAIGLTSVAQPSVGMGARMAEVLLQLLSGERPEPRAIILPTSLVVRESS